MEFSKAILDKSKQQLDDYDKKWKHNFSLGEAAESIAKRFKVAVLGNYGTGKTTMGAEFARLRPGNKVLWLNTEPYENLIEILEDFPDVLQRTKIIPTIENLETIRKEGSKYDAEGIPGGHERAMAEFFLDYIRWLFDKSFDELKGYIVVVDTASQIAKQLRMATYDLVKIGTIDQSTSRFAYGEPKRKFNILAGRLLRLPTDVILLGRVKLEGEYDEQTKKFSYTGNEVAEWGEEIKDTTLWYDANLIVHLFKGDINAEDAKGKNYQDATGEWVTKTIRWAKLLKHKARSDIVPVFFNAKPGDIIEWISQTHQKQQMSA